MKFRSLLKKLSIIGFCFSGAVSASDLPLPDESLYHIDSDWLNQNNETVNITSLQGKVQVVAFVYTYCEYSCPIILAKLKYLENNIPNEYKDGVNFLLISLDPERDTPEVLKNYMYEKKLDENHWLMFSGDPDDVLELAALFGVRYRPMNNTGKDFSHSNMITVLDKNGRISYKMKGLDVSLDGVLAEIRSAAEN